MCAEIGFLKMSYKLFTILTVLALIANFVCCDLESNEDNLELNESQQDQVLSRYERDLEAAETGGAGHGGGGGVVFKGGKVIHHLNMF